MTVTSKTLLLIALVSSILAATATITAAVTVFFFFQSANAFVKITSPVTGQTVPAGSSNLQITGTSDDTADSNCKVLIILNNKHPYQETTPTGAAGQNDYSNWTFTLTPQYTDIEEGINKITAKASCAAPYEPILVQDNTTHTFVKHYSVNVTGVSTTPAEEDNNFVFPLPS